MSIFEAIILGTIQGITEFFPVSSSGHLVLGEYFLNMDQLDQYILFDLICHLGTLCSIFFVYSAHLRDLVKTRSLRFWQLVIAILPLFPLLWLLKPIEFFYHQIQWVGFFFLITSVLLYTGIRWGTEKSEGELKMSWWRDALVIGMFQAIALFPGISRSGSTISGARLLGWKKQDAVTFSFLLAIPTILGGTGIKLIQLLSHPDNYHATLGTAQYFAAFFTSLIAGYIALTLLIKLAAKEKFMYFVWYCLLLGIGTTLYFFTRRP